MNISKLKNSHIFAQLSEIVFRSNTERNTNFTIDTAPTALLEEKAKLPTFILNAINFDILKNILEAYSYPSCTSQLDHITTIAQEQLNNAQDDLSYWLIEVDPHLLEPVINYIETVLEHDIEKIDPKLKSTLEKYLEFKKLGIKTKGDLVNAFKLLQN